MLTAGRVGTAIDGAGNLLGTADDVLIDSLQGTTGALVGVTQNLADVLLGGTKLNQPVQNVAGAVGGVTGGAVSAVGASAGGVISDTTEAPGGIVDGADGTLLKLGF